MPNCDNNYIHLISKTLTPKKASEWTTRPNGLTGIHMDDNWWYLQKLVRPIEFYLLVNRAFFPTTLDKWRDLLKITFLRSLRLDQVESFRGQWRCQVFVFKVGNNSSFFSVFQLAYGGRVAENRKGKELLSKNEINQTGFSRSSLTLKWNASVNEEVRGHGYSNSTGLLTIWRSDNPV